MMYQNGLSSLSVHFGTLWIKRSKLYFYYHIQGILKILDVYTTDTTRSQQIFTCSKSTIETLEKGVKYVQS